jgi:hypothetical protein
MPAWTAYKNESLTFAGAHIKESSTTLSPPSDKNNDNAITEAVGS